MLTIIKPGSNLLTPLEDVLQMPDLLEQAGRTCYKSEDRITPVSADKFVRMICRNHHESVLEHCSVTMKITCSRACSHQLVRHRLASYSQESQRYVNYGQKGFRCVAPESVGLQEGTYECDYSGDWRVFPSESREGWITDNRASLWLHDVHTANKGYLRELKLSTPEDARYLLPNAMATEVVTTMNLRMWRHVFRERALNPKAQLEIRTIFKGIYNMFLATIPCVFGDLE